MKRLIALLMVAMVATGLQVTAASPASATPTAGPTFNTPYPWGKLSARYRIVSKIEAAIRAVPAQSAEYPNPVIHISTYFLDRRSASNELIAACKRGVSVRVILDSGIEDKPAKDLITALNADNVADANNDGIPDKPAKTGPCNTKLEPTPTPTPTTTPTTTATPRAAARAQSAPDPTPSSTPSATASADEPQVDLEGLDEVVDPDTVSSQALQRSVAEPDERAITWGKDGSYVKRCFGSCRGGGGAMHAKFFTFSASGSARDVSMVSSSNINIGGAVRGWNDLITYTGRPALRAYFARMHREMTEDVRNNGQLEQFTDGDTTVRFFPMRQATKSTDPTLRDLNKIRCSSSFGRTQVKISMFYWAHTRGLYLADKVIALGKAGCSVQVIYGAPGADVQRKLTAAAKRGQITLYDSRYKKLPEGDYQTRTHGKFFTVKGTYDGNTRAYLTVTGSQNWAGSSLSAGDEITLNITGSKTHNSYVYNWGRIKAHSRRVR